MNIITLSDTHWKYNLWNLRLPKADILIHAGDFTMLGRPEQICEFNEWLGKQKVKQSIVIAGNHDKLFENDHSLAKSFLTNAIYLEDSLVEIEGLRIYGSPWQPEFGSWAFNLPRGKPLAEKWAKIPNDLDILVTHGPPYVIGDGIPDTVHNPVTGKWEDMVRHIGCEDLLARVKEIKPRFHVFGHAHSGHGVYMRYGINFLNASICDEEYKHTQCPYLIETDTGIITEIK